MGVVRKGSVKRLGEIERGLKIRERSLDIRSDLKSKAVDLKIQKVTTSQRQ
jgi:hypothetical protein